MSNTLMNKTDENIRHRTTYLNLPRTVTGRDLFNALIERAKLTTELQWLEVLKEAGNIYLEREIETRIDVIGKRKNCLDEIIVTRRTTCLVPCEKVEDYLKKQTRFFCCDTGEMVKERAMTAEEWRERPCAVPVGKPRIHKKVLLQGNVPATHQLAASAL